jgi:hypothetical protein
MFTLLRVFIVFLYTQLIQMFTKQVILWNNQPAIEISV